MGLLERNDELIRELSPNVFVIAGFILFFHLVVFLIVRYARVRRIISLKHKLKRQSVRLSQKPYWALLITWILSAFVLTPIFTVFLISFGIFGSLVGIGVAVIYFSIIFSKKSRKDYLTGKTIISGYLLGIIAQAAGYVVFAVISGNSLFHSIFYSQTIVHVPLTRSYIIELPPNRFGLWMMAIGFIIFFFHTAIPIICFYICQAFRYVVIKILEQNKNL